MLRTACSHRFGCCDHCARRRNARAGNKIGERERRLARKIEKRRWKREELV